MAIKFSRSKKIFIIFLISIFSYNWLGFSAYAETISRIKVDQPDNIVKLEIHKYDEIKINTCELLELELELFKVNIFYQINTIQYSVKRYLSLLIGKGFNAQLSLAGMIQSVNYNLKDASYSYVSPTDPLGAIIPRMSGKIILILATLIDYGIEKHRNNIQTLNNVNLHQLDCRIYELMNKINEKIDERYKIFNRINCLLPNTSRVILDETKVLEDLRDLGLIYWRTYHLRELQAFYVDRIFKSTVVLKKGLGVGGAIGRIIGAVTSNPYFTMPTNVVTTSTGLMSMRLPIFTLPLSKKLTNDDRAKLDNIFNIKANDENYDLQKLVERFYKHRKYLQSDLISLNTTEYNNKFKERLNSRMTIYNNFKFDCSEYESAEILDRHLFDPYTKQAMIVKTINGFGRFQRGVFGVVAGTLYLHNHYDRSRLIGFSNIGYLSTSALRSIFWTKGAYNYVKNRKKIDSTIRDFKNFLDAKLNKLDNFENLVETMLSNKDDA